MQSILEKFKNFLLTLTDDELKLFGLMRYDSNENVSYDMDTLIGITLENLGIPEHIRGTPYLRTAIHLACENPDDLKE